MGVLVSYLGERDRDLAERILPARVVQLHRQHLARAKRRQRERRDVRVSARAPAAARVVAVVVVLVVVVGRRPAAACRPSARRQRRARQRRRVRAGAEPEVERLTPLGVVPGRGGAINSSVKLPNRWVASHDMSR